MAKKFMDEMDLEDLNLKSIQKYGRVIEGGNQVFCEKCGEEIYGEDGFYYGEGCYEWEGRLLCEVCYEIAEIRHRKKCFLKGKLEFEKKRSEEWG